MRIFVVKPPKTKRDSTKILTRNDLQGSKMLINFCDSSFAIGESQKVPDLRYIKQIKARNSPIIYHTENVLLCSVEKPHNFVKFRFLETANEREHLRPQVEKDKAAVIARVRELHETGMSQREIAKEVGITRVTVSRYLER